MAAVLLREGRAAEAERAFRESLKDDPKNPEVHDGLGASLLMQGRNKEALPHLNRAVELAPERAGFRINRGLALLELSRYEEAEEDFRVAEASSLPDDRLAAALNRGRLRQRQRNFAAAEAEYTTALSRDPRSFAAVLGRGVAREAQGNLNFAAEDYLEAVRLSPRSAEANLRLGLVLVTLRKEKLGRRYLERTVELDPTGDTGAKARLLLESSSADRPPSSR
jgi:tetratricopeptide (TPR) repeat protein